jgi:AraC-like DNA-binding protein/ABC-type glycerol-3-phosphate transport system substrate-binding protein
MPRKARLHIALPPGVSEAELRRHVVEWLASRQPQASKGSLLLAAPNFASHEEERRFSLQCARLFKTSGLSAELRQRLVTTDVMTEIYAPETDFAVMLVYEPCLGFLARQGLVHPLDGLLKDAQQRFHALGLRRGREGGRIYGAPLFISTRALFYRADLLQKHGHKAPRSFAELEAAAQDIVKREKNPRLHALSLDAQPLNRFNLLLDLLWAQGEEIFTGNGPWAFNSAAWRTAIERLKSLLKLCPQASQNWNSQESAASFLRGESVFCLGWTDLMRQIHESPGEIRRRSAWALHPTEDLASKRMQRLGGPSLVIPRGSRHLKAAERLLPALLDPASQESLLSHPSWPFPAQPGLWSKPMVRAANPWLSEAEEFLKDGTLLEERSFLKGNYLTWQNAVNASAETLNSDDASLKRLEQSLVPLLPQRPFKGLVAQAVELIERRASGPLDVGSLAQELVVSREHFMREFKRQSGVTPLKFIHKKQMEKAKEMLEFTHYHVGEVAQKLGYQDPGYFSRLFKKILKRNPSEFKRKGF